MFFFLGGGRLNTDECMYKQSIYCRLPLCDKLSVPASCHPRKNVYLSRNYVNEGIDRYIYKDEPDRKGILQYLIRRSSPLLRVTLELLKGKYPIL